MIINHSKFQIGWVAGLFTALLAAAAIAYVNDIDGEAIRQCYAEVTRAR